MSKKKNVKVILSAGGTGGHLFPALALARSLKQKREILFIASGLDKNTFFDFSFPYTTVASAFFKKNISLLKLPFTLLKGILQSISILKREKPSLVIGFGSFTTFPVLTAAYFLKIPYILHEQNFRLGVVNRLFHRKAKYIATYFPQCVRGGVHIKHAVHTKYPVSKCWDKTTILIMGGSQGSNFITELCLNTLPYLTHFFFIHLVGKCRETSSVQEVYQKHQVEAKVLTFEKEMGKIYPLCDFAITRAGAGTILELIDFEIPALLIPFSKSKNGHQDENANFFVNHVEGGLFLKETEASSANFTASIFALNIHLKQKKQQLKKYKKQMNPKEFSSLILEE